MSDEGQGIGPPLVRVVDDEAALRLSLDSLFRSVGLGVAAFASIQELLAGDQPEVSGCLVLDVRLPGLSGLDFLSHPTRRDDALPVVFMTGHGDIPMSVRAMKAGAVDFLAKPFLDEDMLDAVAAAIRRDQARRSADAAVAALRARFATLTPREKQVMALVVTGLMNKQVAYEIGLSEITVKIHRGNAMRKMGARSLAELVRQAEVMSLRPPEAGPDQTKG